MKSLPWVPEGAAVHEVLDGHWLLRPAGAAAPIRVALEAGAGQDWWVIRQATAPGLVTDDTPETFVRLFDLMASHPLVKVILPAGRSAELRVELPAADADERRWMQIAIDQLGRANGYLPDIRRSCSASRSSDDSLASALAELGYPSKLIEPAAPTSPDDTHGHAARLTLPAAGDNRLVDVVSTPGWAHLHLCPGISASYPAEQPMQQALLTYLLRIGGGLRLVRASYLTTGASGGQVRFEVHLPTPVTSTWLQHGLAALATAVRQFEQEIEHLATEAILARAYMAISGAAHGVTHHTLEL